VLVICRSIFSMLSSRSWICAFKSWIGRRSGARSRSKNALLYHNKVLAASEQARIVANRQIEFFTPVVNPVVPSRPPGEIA
jgi:hypothetical protein